MINFSEFCYKLGIQRPTINLPYKDGIDIHGDTIKDQAAEVLERCKDLAKHPNNTFEIYELLLKKVSHDKSSKTNTIDNKIDDFYNRLPLDIALDYIKKPQQYGLFENKDIIQLINPNFLRDNH